MPPRALRLEDAALELQAAEEDAAIVRRRVQRSEKAVLRKADLEARRSTGGLYAGVIGLRFHDLRHTGATLAAASGASLRAVMHRLGHASAAAAIRYQHRVPG